MKNFNLKNKIQNFIVSRFLPYSLCKNLKFKTILITRFNYGNDPLGISEKYLNKRFKIFKDLTFPSINSQTDNNFTWIILFRSTTPQKYRNIMETLKTEAKMNLVIHYEDCETHTPEIGSIVSKMIDNDTKYLLTCRCDNDDILANNYIENLKKNFRPINNMFIDFIYGYCLNTNNMKLNKYKSRSNHFIGYVENISKNNNLKTVFYCQHAFIKDFGLIRRINNKNYPLWCEVIHDTNQINHFQGDSTNKYYLDYFNKHFNFIK